MPAVRGPRLGLHLAELDPGLETDSVRRTNAAIRQLLARRYALVPPAQAELLVEGALLRWTEPEAPPRLIFAHGALGDPGHWLMTLPFVRACDCLALSSSSDRAIFERLAGDVRCRTAFLPLFVDTQVFRPRPELRAAVRARHAIAEDAPLLLAVSSLAAGKNVQSVLLLLRELLRARPDARCLVVGAGPRAALEAMVERLQLGAAVSFTGELPRAALSELYAAADLLVHLTLNRKESFGLVSVEAQASGLPVLAGRWGGVADTLAHGQTGFLADAYLVGPERRVDWLSLLPPALGLLSDRARWQRFSRAARARAVREHSPAAFARRLYRTLDHLPLAAADRRRLTLSPAAESLVVAFAARAVEQPSAADSAELSESLRQPFDGEFAYRAVHEQMAMPAPPPRPEPQALAYRLLEAELTPSGQLCVHDPLWAAALQLTAAEIALWNALDRPRTRAELSAQLGAAAEPVLEQLYARGLVGLTHGHLARPASPDEP